MAAKRKPKRPVRARASKPAKSAAPATTRRRAELQTPAISTQFRNPADKRDGERIEILGEFHGEVMLFQPITIKEISTGGAQVETHFPLQLDSLHDFRLTLSDRSIVLKGRVAHCSISDIDQETVVYRSGVEFVDPPDRIHSVIAEFIGAIMGGRRAP